MRYDRRGDSSSQSVRAAGAGARTELGGPGSGAFGGEPRLAVRLTQTIKTAEARSRHLGACREGHFCTRPETRHRGKNKERENEKGRKQRKSAGDEADRPSRGTKCTSLGCRTYFWKERKSNPGVRPGPPSIPLPRPASDVWDALLVTSNPSEDSGLGVGGRWVTSALRRRGSGAPHGF